MDDELFGAGLHLDDPFFLVKAHLKVLVRGLPIPVAQAIVDKLQTIYGTRVITMLAEIDAIIGASSTAKSEGLYVISDGSGDVFKGRIVARPENTDLLKADGAAIKPTAGAKQPATNLSGAPRAKPGQGGGDRKAPPQGVYHPGSRGGQFYMDEHGKVRYGTKPMPSWRPAAEEEVTEHYKHFRPHIFLGSKDKDIVDAIKEIKVGRKGLLSEDDIGFLDFWHENKFGLKGFMRAYGLSEADMDGDLSSLKLKLDGVPIPYEAAVSDYLASMDWGEGNTREDVEAHLKDLFEKYEEALKDPAVAKLAAKKAEKVEQEVYDYFNRMEAMAEKFEPLANSVIAEGDAVKLTTQTAVALAGMDLLFKPKTGEAGAGEQKGMITPNGNMLRETGRIGKLLFMKKDLDRLSVGQLMTIYVASKINSVFDGKKFTVPKTSEDDAYFPDTKLAKVTLDLIQSKLAVGGKVLNTIEGNLDRLSEHMASTFTDANTGANTAIRKMMDLSADDLGDDAKIEEIQNDIAAHEKLCADALEAQQNVNFDLPKTMKGGMTEQINPKTGKPWGMFDHQKQSINWMSVVKRGILALDAGMGKTPTVIAFMEKLKAEGKGKRAILFLPPSLMGQWPAEIKKFAPGVDPKKILNLNGMSLEERKVALQEMGNDAEYILLSSGTLTDKATGMEGAKIMGDDGKEVIDESVINDGTGGMDDELIGVLRKLDAAVFVDEAHQGGYKTAGGVRHEITKQVLKGREHAFGMTATPVPNHPMDLFHLGNLFSPGRIGEQAEWEGGLHSVQFDTDKNQWEVANPDAIVDLNRRLKPFVFHRLITDEAVKKDMGNQLPDLVSESVDLDPSQEKDVQTQVSQMDWIRDDGICDLLADKRVEMLIKEAGDAGNFDHQEKLMSAARIIKGGIKMALMRQAAISPGLIDKRYKGPAPKLDRTVSDVIDHFKGGAGKEGQPLVIFSSFPGKAFPLLRERLKAAGVDPSLIGEIHGALDAKSRAFEQDMTNEGKRKILLVGTMSGGAGLNLQKKANKMMWLDEPWHPSAKRQGQGRVWRTGQQQRTFMNTYRMRGSMDMDIEDKIAGKHTMSVALLGTPNPDAFKDEAANQLKPLSGREQGQNSKDRKVQDLGRLLTGAGSLQSLLDDIGINEKTMGEEFGSWSEENIENIEDPDEMLKRLQKMEDEKTESDAKHGVAKKKLSKEVPHLTSEFDQRSAYKDWEQRQAEMAAGQHHALKQTMAKLADKKGDTEGAAAIRKQAMRMQRDAFSWHTRKLDGAKAAAKAGDKKTAEKLTKEAAELDSDFDGLLSSGKAGTTQPEKGAVEKPGKAAEIPKTPTKPANEKTPSKSKEKPSEETTGTGGIKILKKKSPFTGGEKKTFGADKIDHDTAHYVWSEFAKNPEEGLGEFADRVLKEGWTGRYSRKQGVEFMQQIVDEARKLGAIK